MAVDPFALTSLAEVKTHLNITVTTYDTVLERMINSASARIEQYVDRLLLSRSHTEFQSGRRSDRIILKQFPVTALTEVWIDDSSEFTDVTNKLDAADYDIDQDIGVILKPGLAFPRGSRNIKVIYVAGYATIPYDIEDACIQFVEYLYAKKNDRSITQVSKGKGDEATTFVSGMPDIVKEALDPYKRFDFALSSAGVENG